VVGLAKGSGHSLRPSPCIASRFAAGAHGGLRPTGC
jgi:hypothetical protein